MHIYARIHFYILFITYIYTNMSNSIVLLLQNQVGIYFELFISSNGLYFNLRSTSGKLKKIWEA